MKFSRINDNTIHCIISGEELAGSGVSLDDIMNRKPEAMEYLHRVILEAAREVHMQMSTGFTSMQIQARGDGSILLTISNGLSAENSLKNGTDPMAAIKDAIESILAGGQEEKAAAIKELLPGEQQGDEIEIAGKVSAKEPAATGKRRTLYCYIYQSLADVIECCKRLPILTKMESSLWQNRTEGFYYLYVKVDPKESDNGLPERAILAMNEFGSCCDVSPESAAYVMEHEKCILKKDAAASLARM